MANNYEFKARNPEGQIVTGTLAAEDEAKAEKILWQNKLAVISLSEKKELFGFADSIISRITVRDKVIFTKQLATILESGFPILQALSIIILQTPNKRFKEVVTQIADDLEEGHTFSSAITKHSNVFSVTFINGVKAGEASGKLPAVLRQLSDNLDREYEFISKIRGAVAYPIFIIIVMIVIATIMFIKVIPELENIFNEAGAQLPWVTRFIIGVSHFMQKFWWLMIIVAIGAFIGLKAWGRTQTGRYQIDLFKIKVPVFSRISSLVYMSRFCHTFSLLIATGIPILQAIKIVSDVMANSVYQEVLDTAYQQIEKGVPVNTPLNESAYFPPMVSNMIGVGEKTGKLDDILQSLAAYYELETDAEMKKLSSLLEPVLIVIIGIAVAIMVFAIIMPIYNLAAII